MIDVAADTARATAAALSLIALFLLGLAVVRHPPGAGWTLVIWSFVVNQAVISYAANARRHATPPGLPEGDVDLVLVLVVMSSLAIVVATLGVFVGQRRDRSPRPE